MEISDCIWDEGFPLTVEELGDLEESLSTSIDSPELVPFQFAGGPLLDEADNADMTPQCMPVIDPNFVRENIIEGCVLDGVSDVISASGGDDILTDYLIGQESCDIFRCLHILVCGFCQAVYHTVEEFKSHISTCSYSYSRQTNPSKITPELSTSSINNGSSNALALVLWTSAVLRRVRHTNLTQVISPDLQLDLCSRIQAKWGSLDTQTKQVWEKAADALQELARVGDLVFPEQQQQRQQEDSNHQHVQQPHQLQINQFQSEFQDSLASGCEYIDEIELPCVTSNYDQTHDNARLQNGYGPTNNYQRSDTNISSAILNNHNMQEKRDNSRKRKFSISDTISLHQEQDTTKKRSSENQQNTKDKCDKPKTINQIRDRNGRWYNPEKVSQADNDVKINCDPCRFSTTNPWKFTRHTHTKRHLEIVNKVNIESVTGDVLNISADHTNKTSDQMYKTADHTNKTADNTSKLAGPVGQSANQMYKTAGHMDQSADQMSKTADQMYKSADATNKTADNANKSAYHTNKTADLTNKSADNFKDAREHEISETNDEIAVNGFAITKDTPENNLDDDNTEKKQEQAVAKTQSHCDNEKKRCNGTRDENFKTDGTQQASNIVREEKNNNSNNIMTANETPKEIDNDNLNTTCNSNKSEVNLKRKSKVDSTSLGFVPSSQRISSKRSSALAAGKRLQDWTSILGKR